MVARQQRFVSSDNECAPRIGSFEYVRSQVLDHGLDFVSVRNKGIARALPGRRLIEQHATAD